MHLYDRPLPRSEKRKPTIQLAPGDIASTMGGKARFILHETFPVPDVTSEYILRSIQHVVRLQHLWYSNGLDQLGRGVGRLVSVRESILVMVDSGIGGLCNLRADPDAWPVRWRDQSPCASTTSPACSPHKEATIWACCGSSRSLGDLSSPETA